MKFEVIEHNWDGSIEFPKDWFLPGINNNNETYIKTSVNTIQVITGGDYVNVPLIGKNFDENEIIQHQENLLNSLKENGLICKEGDCVHVKSSDNGDIYHGFAILNTYPALSGFAL